MHIVIVLDKPKFFATTKINSTLHKQNQLKMQELTLLFLLTSKSHTIEHVLLYYQLPKHLRLSCWSSLQHSS